MARYFLDTSAIIKLYKDEPNSPGIRAILTPADDVAIAETTPLEYRSAFAILVRSGYVSAQDAPAYIAAFEAGRPQYAVVRLSTEVVMQAEGLMVGHAASDGLRTLDAIQLACALAAHRQEPLDALVTTDKTLARLAAAHGLTVLP